MSLSNMLSVLDEIFQDYEIRTNYDQNKSLSNMLSVLGEIFNDNISEYSIDTVIYSNQSDVTDTSDYYDTSDYEYDSDRTIY
jgi:hypothetical protein